MSRASKASRLTTTTQTQWLARQQAEFLSIYNSNSSSRYSHSNIFNKLSKVASTRRPIAWLQINSSSNSLNSCKINNKLACHSSSCLLWWRPSKRPNRTTTRLVPSLSLSRRPPSTRTALYRIRVALSSSHRNKFNSSKLWRPCSMQSASLRSRSSK